MSVEHNHPDLWLEALPRKQAGGYKYDSGVVHIFGAPKLTGATRLAAESCARMGAGLVSVIAPDGTGDIYRTVLPAHILVYDLGDEPVKVSARLYGPGGMAPGVKLSLNRSAVIDADALACLPERLHEQIVLTPHEGEFARAFPDLQGARDERALAAAERTGAVVVLKGAETVIAHPDGRVVVNAHASPHLATAGSGDVLAGMIAGLMAQGMNGFAAACAAVWVHGDAALKFGAGLVAGDLIEMIPEILQEELGF